MSSKSNRAADAMTSEAKKSAQESCARVAHLLQSYQKKTLGVKEKIKNAKNVQVSAQVKNEIDVLVLEMKEIESEIKSLISAQTTELGKYPPPAVGVPIAQDIAQFRTVLTKLAKDFDKAKQSTLEVYADVRFVQLNPKELNEYNQLVSARQSEKSVGTTLSLSSGGSGSGRMTNNPISTTSSMSYSTRSDPGQLEKLQEKQLNLMAVQESVDDTIINERCADIEKIHSSSVMLNEMFVDLSKLVEVQGEAIDQIHQNASETHAKTEQGMDQLKQAEQLQKSGNSMCVIS